MKVRKRLVFILTLLALSYLVLNYSGKYKKYKRKFVPNLQNSCRHTVFKDCEDLCSGQQRMWEGEFQPQIDTSFQISNCDLHVFGKDCKLFKKALGYPDHPFSPEERDFPLAYSIRMHKDPDQVEMLLRAIFAPQNLYCIYIDKKSPPEVHKAMESLVQCFQNVFIVSSIKPFYYGTASQMEADLQCMRELCKRSDRWKYYLNLAGQEFPLKTNREIVHILRLLNGTNDIEVGPFSRGLLWRIVNRVVPDKEEGFKFADMKKDDLDVSLTLYKGSAYGAFHRNFVHFLLNDIRVQRLYHWLRDTFAPEETLFATANALPGAPGGYNIVVNQDYEVGHHISRVVVWKWTKHAPCHGKYIRSVCILSCRDVKWLVQRPQLIANKFDIQFDNSVIVCLLQHILSRRSKPTSINMTYYRTLPHVRLAINT